MSSTWIHLYRPFHVVAYFDVALALLVLGVRHPGSVRAIPRTTQIPDGIRGLLHQMSQRVSIGKYHDMSYPDSGSPEPL